MKRIHALEWEDQPWFPAAWRDYGTDYLRFIAHLQLGRAGRIGSQPKKYRNLYVGDWREKARPFGNSVSAGGAEVGGKDIHQTYFLSKK